MKKYLLVAIGCVLLFAGCAGASNDLVIDFHMDMANMENGHFNWTYDGKETKDSFDTKTGASVAQSTANFNIVRYDSEETKRFAMPYGLRGLVLYPVSAPSVTLFDAFTVTGDSKSFVIKFIHRGSAYQITVVNGKMDLANGFKMASGLCDNVDGNFMVKEQFLTAGGDKTKMSDLDWAKISLVSDTAAADASRSFVGELNASYENNVLVVDGTLTEK